MENGDGRDIGNNEREGAIDKDNNNSDHGNVLRDDEENNEDDDISKFLKQGFRVQTNHVW